MYNPAHFRFRSSGIALVLVLWIIVMLSIMAASFSLNLRREIDLVGNVRGEAEAGSVAEAGIYYAMLRLIANNEQKKWRSDGSVYEILFAGARVRIRIYDEGGKYDLNTSQPLLLIGLMQKMGLSDVEPEALVDAMEDWKDSDSDKRPKGAEADEYEDAGRTYGPSNKPFQTIEELRLVLGIAGDLYRRLEPLTTVYNSTPGIDPSKSSKEVLMTLPGVTEEIIDTYLEQRAASSQNNPPPFPFPPEGNLQVTQAIGVAFSVHSEALFPDGRHAGVSAVITNANNPPPPFVFVEWKKQFPGEGSLFGESVVVVEPNGADGP
ncbi:MAG: general secretion pathway protein GspK [Methylococcales bacterium]